MKRIALIATCLALMLAIPSGADGVHRHTQIAVETTWIDLHDTSVLPEPVVSDDIGAPQTMLLTDMTDEEVATVAEAGTIVNEPAIILINGRPGASGFSADFDDDGKPDAESGVRAVASVLDSGDFSLQVDFWSYDERPQAPEAETSLRALLRVAEGETALLARVDKGGAILNPVYLLTARVIDN
jgi:hypothetical protein